MSPHTMLKIDGHVFNVPTDTVKSIYFIRKQAITSYRAVADGKPTPRDLAFLFGTVTMSSRKRKHAIFVESEAEDEEEEDEEEELEEEEVLEGGEKELEEGEELEEEQLEEEEVVEGGGGLEEDVVMKEEEESEEEEELEEERVVEEDEEDEEVDENEDENGNDCNDSNDGSYREGPSRSLEIRGGQTRNREATALRKKLLSGRNENMFVGDFKNFHDAQETTGLSYKWLRTRYIEGLLKIDGRLANVTVMNGRERCRGCINAKPWDGAVCRVLVRHGGNAIRGARCGYCLKVGKGCYFDN